VDSSIPNIFARSAKIRLEKNFFDGILAGLFTLAPVHQERGGRPERASDVLQADLRQG
jgi:hypothetical protein